jgi:hypothetical protein
VTDRKRAACAFAFAFNLASAETAWAEAPPGQPGAPYQHMPAIAIGVLVVQCVNSVTPKWQSRLAAFDVFIWDQC